jgi:ferric-dicitrate binding protein FerR (iron transport regulator)
MDQSFDDLEIDYVVADLNRMKQGMITFLDAVRR